MLAAGVPFATTIVGIMTAFGTVLTAVSLVIASAAVWRKSKQTDVKLKEIKQTGDETHVIVNQQRTDMVNLIISLQKRGIVLEKTIIDGGLQVPNSNPREYLEGERES